jgi:hypothetical protein
MWFAELGCRELFQRTTLPMFDGRQRVPGRIRKRRGVIDFGNNAVRSPTYEETNGSLYGPVRQQLPAARFVNVPGHVREDVAAGRG